MGAWGYNPCDTDEGYEFLLNAIRSSDCSKYVHSNCHFALKDQYYDETRAVAHLLATIDKYVNSPHLFKEHVKKAIQKLEVLLKDQKWIEGWNDPKAIKASIKKQITSLKRCLSKIE